MSEDLRHDEKKRIEDWIFNRTDAKVISDSEYHIVWEIINDRMRPVVEENANLHIRLGQKIQEVERLQKVNGDWKENYIAWTETAHEAKGELAEFRQNVKLLLALMEGDIEEWRKEYGPDGWDGTPAPISVAGRYANFIREHLNEVTVP